MPLPMTTQETEAFFEDVHYGYNPYEERYLNGTTNFTTLPHCMHFYYMGFDGAKQDFRHYYHDNGDDPIAYDYVPTLMGKLARNAVFKDYNPPKHGEDFRDIVWRRRSYVAVLMNSPLYKFWNNAGLHFLDKNNGTENFSFFDARDFMLDVPAIGGGMVARSAMFCMNHMKKDAIGNNIDSGQSLFYSYEFVFQLGNMTDQPWRYDPGGTNQGPPETP